jgi:TPR repeat protein
VRAREWFTKAADAGQAGAYYSLGLIYENGLGVRADPARATDYYRRAAAGGDARGAERAQSIAGATASTTPAPVATAAPASPAAPPAETVSPPARPGKALARAGIGEVQRLLKQLNFEPGPSDGVAGDRTIEAIRLYQQFAGLTVDGKPTESLLQDLRQVVGAMDTGAAGPR